MSLDQGSVQKVLDRPITNQPLQGWNDLEAVVREETNIWGKSIRREGTVGEADLIFVNAPEIGGSISFGRDAGDTHLTNDVEVGKKQLLVDHLATGYILRDAPGVTNKSYWLNKDTKTFEFSKDGNHSEFLNSYASYVKLNDGLVYAFFQRNFPGRRDCIICLKVDEKELINALTEGREDIFVGEELSKTLVKH